MSKFQTGKTKEEIIQLAFMVGIAHTLKQEPNLDAMHSDIEGFKCSAYLGGGLVVIHIEDKDGMMTSSGASTKDLIDMIDDAQLKAKQVYGEPVGNVALEIVRRAFVLNARVTVSHENDGEFLPCTNYAAAISEITACASAGVRIEINGRQDWMLVVNPPAVSEHETASDFTTGGFIEDMYQEIMSRQEC